MTADDINVKVYLKPSGKPIYCTVWRAAELISYGQATSEQPDPQGPQSQKVKDWMGDYDNY